MEKKVQINGDDNKKEVLFNDNSAAIDDYDDDNDDTDETDDNDFADIANPGKIRPNLTNDKPKFQPMYSNPNNNNNNMYQQQNQNNNNMFNENNDDEDEDDDDDENDMGSVVSKQSGISNESEKLDLLMKLDN